MIKFHEANKVVHKSGVTGKIKRCYYWEHSGFEFYSMLPDNPEVETLYGIPEDFELIEPEEQASVPQ